MLVHITGVALVLLLAESAQAIVRPNNLGKLPALGYNNYNAYICAYNESDLLAEANSIVSLGLKAAGYEYVNVDDCWSVKKARDPTTGRIVPDPTKFPNGISGTAAKIHALGLKMGIYSSAGVVTCRGYPASLGNELLDATTFAEWGIDYLKYDNCGWSASDNDQYTFCVPDTANPGPFVNGTCNYSNQAPKGYDWSTSNTAKRFQAMGAAIANQSHPILYSLCEWGRADVTTWGNKIASSWRTTPDITAKWSGIAQILNENSFLLNAVDFWGHNDADMLEVGNGALTAAETRTHFAFWAAMKSPLIIGTKLSSLSAANLAILKNEYLLAFNQDASYGKPATPYKWGTNKDWTFDASHPAEYWSGSSSKGVLVLMLNTGSATQARTATWSEIPQLTGSAYHVTDIWSGANLGCVKGGIARNLTTHDTAGFLVGAAC